MNALGSLRSGRRRSRRQLLKCVASAFAALGAGPARSAAPTARANGPANGRPSGKTLGTLRDVALRDVRRIDAAGDGGWWARDGAGRLWHVARNATTTPVADGLDPSGALMSGHGRIAGRGLDGRLWIHDVAQPGHAPGRSHLPISPHGGLCVLPLAVIAVVEHADGHVLARFEPDASGQWQVVARSREPVLPDAVPIAVDLDGRSGGAHIAVLAGPDAKRYPHAVLGDGIEATGVVWLERHSLAPQRTLHLDAPAVFEDRLLRPWRCPDGRTGLVTVRSGPLGAQMVVVAASLNESAGLQIAAAGPAIGTRNRWLSPASVAADGGDIWAVHTPHIGGVLHRYRAQGSTLAAEPLTAGLTNHRIGSRDLDVSARVGRWLLLPTQDWRGTHAVDTTTSAMLAAIPVGAPIVQWVPSASGDSAVVLTESRVAVWSA